MLVHDVETEKALVDFLRQHRSGRRTKVLCAIDIGGTNARVAFVAFHSGPFTMPESAPVVQIKRRIKSKRVLLDFLKSVAGAVSDCVEVVGAAFAGPGPRDATATRIGPFSNYEGDDRVIHSKDIPPTLFPPARSCIMNDLEAGSYGIVSLSIGGEMDKCFTTMWPSASSPSSPSPIKIDLDKGPCLILAAGTGLGTGLVYRGAGGAPVVMPLEFGHASVVEEEEDRDFYRFAKSRVGRGMRPLEYDDVCGGRGVGFAYEFVTGGDKCPPEEISARALRGDEKAVQAYWHHYKALTNLASNLTMGFQLGTVIIAGDNARHNQRILAGLTPRLRTYHLSHTTERMGFMSRPTFLRQIGQHNLNLQGCFFSAHSLAAPGPHAVAKL
eukprot:Sspe_Gene.35504::Locus_17196_Transcript_2_2_Confidence_0.500_Length_1338::g.35504::m.35504/K00845/glk; glucokinase